MAGGDIPTGSERTGITEGAGSFCDSTPADIIRNTRACLRIVSADTVPMDAIFDRIQEMSKPLNLAGNKASKGMADCGRFSGALVFCLEEELFSNGFLSEVSKETICPNGCPVGIILTVKWVTYGGSCP